MERQLPQWPLQNASVQPPNFVYNSAEKRKFCLKVSRILLSRYMQVFPPKMSNNLPPLGGFACLMHYIPISSDINNWQAGKSLRRAMAVVAKEPCQFERIGYILLRQVWKRMWSVSLASLHFWGTRINKNGASKRVLTIGLSITFTYGLWHWKRINSQDVGV